MNIYFVETERRIWWTGDNYAEPNTEDEVFFALVFAETPRQAKAMFRSAGICPYSSCDPLAVTFIKNNVDRTEGVASDDDDLWITAWDTVYGSELE